MDLECFTDHRIPLLIIHLGFDHFGEFCNPWVVELSAIPITMSGLAGGHQLHQGVQRIIRPRGPSKHEKTGVVALRLPNLIEMF